MSLSTLLIPDITEHFLSLKLRTLMSMVRQRIQVYESMKTTMVRTNPTGSNIELSTDTVTSASPYVFNVSLRSIFGMCGMRSMVVRLMDSSPWS